MTLERIETKRGHKYELDGFEVKGVTTLIGNGMPKPALPYWSAKVVAEYVMENLDKVDQLANGDKEEAIKHLKMIPWTHRDKAAARGTEIHRIAETIIHGGMEEVPVEIAGYVTGYVDFIDKWSAEPILTEKVVGSRLWSYAGTFDAILKFHRGPLKGKVYLCDWKTSSGVYGEMAMQLIAYGKADFYLDENGKECQLPAIDGYGIVHISPEATTFHVVEDEVIAWDAFLTVIQLANKLKSIEKLLKPLEGE